VRSAGAAETWYVGQTEQANVGLDAGSKHPMWKRALIVAVTLVACGTCPGKPGVVESSAGHGSKRDLTCDEQVRQVQPVPTGDFRSDYVWKCLLEHEFEAFIGERKACSAPRDCVEVQTYCPFGEGVLVAHTYADEVEMKHRELFERYSKRASCKARSEPHGAPTCDSGRCAYLPWSPPASQ
jgi:hypothetical protein